MTNPVLIKKEVKIMRAVEEMNLENSLKNCGT
jgi:hypothetical protein